MKENEINSENLAMQTLISRLFILFAFCPDVFSMKNKITEKRKKAC